MLSKSFNSGCILYSFEKLKISSMHEEIFMMNDFIITIEFIPGSSKYKVFDENFQQAKDQENFLNILGKPRIKLVECSNILIVFDNSTNYSIWDLTSLKMLAEVENEKISYSEKYPVDKISTDFKTKKQLETFIELTKGMTDKTRIVFTNNFENSKIKTVRYDLILGKKSEKEDHVGDTITKIILYDFVTNVEIPYPTDDDFNGEANMHVINDKIEFYYEIYDERTGEQHFIDIEFKDFVNTLPKVNLNFEAATVFNVANYDYGLSHGIRSYKHIIINGKTINIRSISHYGFHSLDIEDIVDVVKEELLYSIEEEFASPIYLEVDCGFLISLKNETVYSIFPSCDIHTNNNINSKFKEKVFIDCGGDFVLLNFIGKDNPLTTELSKRVFFEICTLITKMFGKDVGGIIIEKFINDDF